VSKESPRYFVKSVTIYQITRCPFPVYRNFAVILLKKFRVMPTQCVYVLHKILEKKNLYIPVHYKLFGLCGGDVMRSLKYYTIFAYFPYLKKQK
jgi:hypothetical protein